MFLLIFIVLGLFFVFLSSFGSGFIRFIDSFHYFRLILTIFTDVPGGLLGARGVALGSSWEARGAAVGAGVAVGCCIGNCRVLPW